jgi:hypothetical protein
MGSPGKKISALFPTGYVMLKEIYNRRDIVMNAQKVRREEFKVEGKDLEEKIKGLLHEGNIRRIIVKDKEDRTLIEIPLTIGVLSVLLAPQLAALGAIAMFAGMVTLVVEIIEE